MLRHAQAEFTTYCLEFHYVSPEGHPKAGRLEFPQPDCVAGLTPQQALERHITKLADWLEEGIKLFGGETLSIRRIEEVDFEVSGAMPLGVV